MVAYDYHLNPPEPSEADLAYEAECEQRHGEVMDEIMSGGCDEFWGDLHDSIQAAVREAMKGTMGHNRPEWIAKTITDAVRAEATLYADWIVEKI